MAKLITKANNFLNFAYFFNFLRAVELKANLGAMVCLHSYRIESPHNQVKAELCLAILIILVYFAGITFLSMVIVPRWRQRRNKIRDKVDNNQFIIDALTLQKEYKVGITENPHHPEIAEIVLLTNIVTDFAIPAVLVVFINTPSAQIFSLLILVGICLYQVIRYRPYNQGPRNVLEIANRCIFILILIIFLVAHASKERLSYKAEFSYIGYSIIGLLIILIGFNLVISVIHLVSKLRALIKKKQPPAEKEEENSKGVDERGIPVAGMSTQNQGVGGGSHKPEQPVERIGKLERFSSRKRQSPVSPFSNRSGKAENEEEKEENLDQTKSGELKKQGTSRREFQEGRRKFTRLFMEKNSTKKSKENLRKFRMRKEQAQQPNENDGTGLGNDLKQNRLSGAEEISLH